jgi:hypothetical protein
MSLPELKFKMGADPSGVKSGTAEAKGAVKGLADQISSMGDFAFKASQLVKVSFATIKGAIMSAGVDAAKAAVEIDNLSRLANANTTAFQKMAAGAKSVGVEQEQLAGMLKDVNDRVGEFIATGAGPMQDFFDNIAPKVGVTADQFARLSGPEAMQLYVSSLEKAGLSQQQMTFYMEGLSGDMTKLLPLLRNGGDEMTRLGDAAEASGRILSEDMIRGGKELDDLFTDIAETLRTSATAAVLEHKDELISLATWISDTVIPALGDLLSAANDAVTDLQPAIEAWGRLARAIGAAAGVDTSAFDPKADTSGDGYEYSDNPGDFTDSSGGSSTTGTWPLDEKGNVIMDDGPALVTKPVITPPSKPGSNKGKGGGKKGGKDSSKADLERIRDQYATEQELLDQHLKDQLAKLEEFRAKKLAGEEELASMEQKIREDHAEKMKAIDAAAMQARLAAWSSGLGDLSSLMSSSNKTLFKIGKGAALAQAVVDGWSAATSAWDKGMKVGGPPAAAAFAGFSLAKTGMMISQINSTQIGSGGGAGGGSIGGGGTPSVAAATPVQRVDIGWDGPPSMLPSMQATIDTLNAAAKAGYRVDVNLVSKQ